MPTNAYLTSPRSSGGTSISVTCGPPGGLAFPTTLAVIRSGAVLTALTATAWSGKTVTVSGAASGFSDANLVVGDYLSTAGVAYLPLAASATVDSEGRIVGTAGGGGGSGTVTSVALTLPSIITVSGSPVTSSGTLAGTLATQSANTIFAGPTASPSATPTFRALVAADIPAIAESGVTNLVTDLAAKAPLASPHFTGTASFAGSGSGTTSLLAAATASGTLTLPAATDTLVGKATTDTLTNKTLTAPVITAANISSHYGAITSDTDGATVTFDLSASDKHTVTLGGNRTLALSNATVGQQFVIVLVQDGTGSRTVTWFSTIKWAGGSAPTLTTTAGKADVFTFLCVSSGNYYGFVAGQNL